MWVLDKHLTDKVEIWERKVLRRIFGGLKEGGEWRRRKNEAFQEPTIGVVNKKNRLFVIGSPTENGRTGPTSRIL